MVSKILTILFIVNDVLNLRVRRIRDKIIYLTITVYHLQPFSRRCVTPVVLAITAQTHIGPLAQLGEYMYPRKNNEMIHFHPVPYPLGFDLIFFNEIGVSIQWAFLFFKYSCSFNLGEPIVFWIRVRSWHVSAMRLQPYIRKRADVGYGF